MNNIYVVHLCSIFYKMKKLNTDLRPNSTFNLNTILHCIVRSQCLQLIDGSTQFWNTALCSSDPYCHPTNQYANSHISPKHTNWRNVLKLIFHEQPTNCSPTISSGQPPSSPLPLTSHPKITLRRDAVNSSHRTRVTQHQAFYDTIFAQQAIPYKYYIYICASTNDTATRARHVVAEWFFD